MDRDEYPLNVPISRIRVAPVAKTNSSRNRPSRLPTIMPGAARLDRVYSATSRR